jgi:hypothetical protein
MSIKEIVTFLENGRTFTPFQRLIAEYVAIKVIVSVPEHGAQGDAMIIAFETANSVINTFVQRLLQNQNLDSFVFEDYPQEFLLERDPDFI